jgi:hypothetical protein
VGLDAFAAQTSGELVDPLRDLGHHWLGGPVTGAPFTVDGTGTLQFRIPPGALAERDVSPVVTVAESR